MELISTERAVILHFFTSKTYIIDIK